MKSLVQSDKWITVRMLLVVLSFAIFQPASAQAVSLIEKVDSMINEINKIEDAKAVERGAIYGRAVTAIDSIWASSSIEYKTLIINEGEPLDSVYKAVTSSINGIDKEKVEKGLAAITSLKDTLSRFKVLLNVPVLVDFTGQACKACKVMKSRLENINKSIGDKIRIVYVLVNEQKDLTKKYKIMLIPTMVLLDTAGKEVWRLTGEIEEQKLINKIEAYLKVE